MKIYLDENVFDAALNRIRWLFDEFDNVIACMSGGKDSTVIFNLCMKVAQERNRLPLSVLFIDQEAEWQATIDYVRIVMQDPRVNPIWLQIPIILFNSTSTTEPWLHCWEPGKQWIREKETYSVHENRFGTIRFKELFGRFLRTDYPDGNACLVGGVRAEESPTRFMGMTVGETYKGVTWGNQAYPGYFTFYPIYDWSYTDIWKAIHDNGWPYCRLYDLQYMHGIPILKMRVSNVHHETALQSLFYLQEFEADTWNRITARLSGINTVGQLREDFLCPKSLPPAFSNWVEYCDYLLENLTTDKAVREKMRKRFQANYKKLREGYYKNGVTIEHVAKEHITCILVNDYYFTKLDNADAAWRREHAKVGVTTLHSNVSMEDLL